MAVLRDLEPGRVFYYFEKISQIPRVSGNKKEICEYFVSFAEKHHLKYLKDSEGNIIIWKKATVGYEMSPPVILQGHYDMVAVKQAGFSHDFAKEGLKLRIVDERIYAKGTSLGADDGIGVAYCLAILESDEISHPALEVVLTADEEIGLKGASKLDTSVLKSRRLINLDYSEEGTLLAGCAGGVNVSGSFECKGKKVNGKSFEVIVSGLKGGHSGTQIGYIHANANVLAGCFLCGLKQQMDYELYEFKGGTNTNVIPSSAEFSIIISEKDKNTLIQYTNVFLKNIKREYGNSEEGLELKLVEKEQVSALCFKRQELNSFLCFLQNAPDGVKKMSGSIEKIVETSVNLGIVRFEKGKWSAEFGIRSMFDSAKKAVAQGIQCFVECLGGIYKQKEEYPAWQYQENSEFRTIAVKIYEELFGYSPQISMVHAGLECGYFAQKIQDLECISFAPTMYQIHSTKEQLDILSTQRMWEYLKKILANL